MKRVRGYIRLILLLPLVNPASVLASVSSPDIVIVEVQTTGKDNKTDEEFVELYNPGTVSVDVSTWKLQYRSAAGASWQTKATLNGFIYPGGRLLISSNTYLEDADVTFAPGFKLEAGHVRIASPATYDQSELVTRDLVGWGTALYPEAESAAYPPSGNSLVRKVDVTGSYIDTDNNKADFEISTLPTPESANIDEGPEDAVVDDTAEELVEQAADDLPQESVTEDTEQVVQTYSDNPSGVSDLPAVEISELLPNPAPPASDSTDEYIELYNPNDESFDLSGYQLQTGNSFSYSFTIEGVTVDAHSYKTFYVSETGLTLANSSGRARMISPNGTVTFQTDPYENAKDGYAWSNIDGIWQWTTEPSPGRPNVLITPITNTDTKSTTKVSTKKPAKPKATKTSKPKTAKAEKKKTEKPNVAGVTNESNQDPSSGSSPVSNWVIAVVGIIAIGYALYEYKDDIRNKFLELKRNRAISRSTRSST